MFGFPRRAATGNTMCRSSAGWRPSKSSEVRTFIGLATGDSPTFAGLTTTGAVRIGGSLSLGTLSVPSLRQRDFGYSTAYTATVLGSETVGNYSNICLGVDPTAILGGSFSGDGRELFLRRNVTLMQPNAGGTDWEQADINAGTATFVGNVGLGVAPITGSGASKWISCNGSSGIGGGFITAIDGVAAGYVYTYGGYMTVQSVTGLRLQTNGGDTALSFEANRVASFTSPTAPTTAPANTVSIGQGKIDAAGSITAGGAIEAAVGGSCLSLTPGSLDHCYLGFYPRTSNPSTRGGYFGFAGAGHTTMTMVAELGFMSFQSSTAPGTAGANEVRIGAGAIDAAGDIKSGGYIWTDRYLRVNAFTTPASATDTGVAGTMCFDTNYIYVCTATNTWKRVAIATW